MGQFSWYAQDTGEQIYNDWDVYGDRQTVHMVDPRNGQDYVETGYRGYGVFGGLDYYILLSDLNRNLIETRYSSRNDLKTYERLYNKPMNELTDEEIRDRRLDGIQIEDCPLVKTFPILVMDYNRWKEFIDKKPKRDENQGWHWQEDEDGDA